MGRNKSVEHTAGGKRVVVAGMDMVEMAVPGLLALVFEIKESHPMLGWDMMVVVSVVKPIFLRDTFGWKPEEELADETAAVAAAVVG